VKTLSLQDFYADPHRLDALLEAGESVEVVRDGQTVADIVPRKVIRRVESANPRPDFRARLLKMWGAEALNSQISVAEDLAEVRRPREM
jgi:antitoxin (DNA-binding transcriptional repressor) of toxin-antitoxin stability system